MRPSFSFAKTMQIRGIKTESDMFGDQTVLKLGIFDPMPHPETEFFVKRRQPWVSAAQDAKQVQALSNDEKEDT